MINYRLVCHDWNTVIQRLQPSLAICNFHQPNGKVPPGVLSPPFEERLSPVQRLEVWTPYQCKCGANPPCIHAEDEESHHSTDRRYSLPFTPSTDLGRLVVFVAPCYMPQICPTSLLDRMTKLKALSWGDQWHRLYFEQILRHKVHQQLTHLSMRFSWNDPNRLYEPIHLPCLLHLSITISAYGRGQPLAEGPKGLRLDNWAVLPALRSLEIDAAMMNGHSDMLYAFIASYGSRLRSLKLGIFDFSSEISFTITRDMWEYLPCLVEFGPGMHLLTRDPSPPPAHIGPIDILFSFKGDHLMGPLWTFQTLDDCFTTLSQVCDLWKTRVATMKQSWREVDDLIENDDVLRHYQEGANPLCNLPQYSRFYELLSDIGVEVRDCYGVSVTNPAGSRVLEKLRLYEHNHPSPLTPSSSLA